MLCMRFINTYYDHFLDDRDDVMIKLTQGVTIGSIDMQSWMDHTVGRFSILFEKLMN